MSKSLFSPLFSPLPDSFLTSCPLLLIKVLPKKYRLHDYLEIKKVKKEGKLYQSPLFGVLILPRKDKEVSRFAFVVSLKISKKSTERNKIRRLFSEAVRLLVPKILSGYDFVFLAKKEIRGKDFLEIKIEIEKFFNQTKVI